MNMQVCGSCGQEFDVDEGGSVDAMPDDTNFALCFDCLSRMERANRILLDW